MAALKCACPKCRAPLQISQALPARITCPACKASFTVSPPNQPAQPAGVQQSAYPQQGAFSQQPYQAPASQPGMMPQPNQQGFTPAPGQGMAPPSYRSNSGGGSSNSAVVAIIVAAVLLLIVGGITLAVMLSSGGTTQAKKGGGNGSGGDDFSGDPDDFGGVKAKPAMKSDPRVNAAIEKGVAYLKKRINDRQDLYYFGGTRDVHIGAMALAGLTLLECGVPATDRDVRKVLNVIRINGSQKGDNRIYFTYTLALNILFLDRINQSKAFPKAEKDRNADLIRKYALQIIAAQHETGGWCYRCQILTPDEENRLMQQLKNDTFRPGRFEVPGKLLPFGEEYWDNSIGQFCLLALWATRKYNIRVDRTLVVEEQRYRRQQLGDGSWYYREAVQGQRDATTCAGLIGLAVGKAIQDEMNKGMGEKNKNVKVLNDPKIKDGLEFLSRVIGKESRLSKREKKKRRELTERIDDLNRALLESRQRKPAEIKRDIEKLDTDELATGIYFGGDAWGDLYLLWSMERVAVIYGLDKINGKDWYGWGKEIILDNQERDGSWRERFPGVPDTCFALLFLKRANIAKDLTDKLQRLTAMLGIGAPPEDRNRPPADRQGLPPRRDA